MFETAPVTRPFSNVTKGALSLPFCQREVITGRELPAAIGPATGSTTGQYR